MSALIVKQRRARQLREQLTGCGNHCHQEEREELLAGHVCCFVCKREAGGVELAGKALRFDPIVKGWVWDRQVSSINVAWVGTLLIAHPRCRTGCPPYTQGELDFPESEGILGTLA